MHTREEFETTYKDARDLVAGVPKHVEYIDKIYNNPKYYGGYVIAGIVGNLGMQGDVPVEQNHSSAVQHLGKEGNFKAVDHLTRLM